MTESNNKSKIWVVLPWILFGFSLIVIFTVSWKSSWFSFFNTEQLNQLLPEKHKN
jgi:hypothetical protein